VGVVKREGELLNTQLGRKLILLWNLSHNMQHRIPDQAWSENTRNQVTFAIRDRMETMKDEDACVMLDDEITDSLDRIFDIEMQNDQICQCALLDCLVLSLGRPLTATLVKVRK